MSHRLAVLNQRPEHADKSVAKESQNRYSRTAKDWGWREFVTLTTLFDQDAGFLINDTVVFSAEVLILKARGRTTTHSHHRVEKHVTCVFLYILSACLDPIGLRTLTTATD